MKNNETPEKTLQQHADDLQKWLDERGLMPMVVARGKIDGAITSAQNWATHTHTFTFILTKKPANNGPAS